MKNPPGDIIIWHRRTINDNHMMYGSWDTKHDRQNFLSFWTIFCPITPLTTQKIKISKKLKKLPGDIFILHKCTINDTHDVWFLRYEAWWTKFFVILDCICNQNFEKLKKHLEISTFYTSVPKIMIICYTVP